MLRAVSNTQRHDRTRWQRLTILMVPFTTTLLWLVLCLWNWYSLGSMWARAMRPERDHVVDFYQEWGSAHNYWSGVPVYSPHSTSVPRYLGLAANPVPMIEYNIHPPTSVLLILPLGRLNYPDAVLVWNLISLLAFLASLVIVAIVLSAPASLVLPALTLLPLCHPVYGNLHQGQLNLVLVLLVTVTWALERSHYSLTAGGMLGVAAAIKLFPIYLAIYYAAQRRMRPLLATVVTFLTLTLFTTLVLGSHTYNDYLTIVLPWNAEFRILGYNLSIAGLWHKLFYPVLGERIIPLYSSLVVARWGTLLSNLMITMIVIMLTQRARTTPQCDLAFAMTAVAMLLVSPVTWDAALPILLVPFALIAHSPLTARSRRLTATLITILVINWIPQQILTRLALACHSTNDYSWVFMLGFPSLKFYTLLATFGLVLITFSFDVANPQLKPTGKDVII